MGEMVADASLGAKIPPTEMGLARLLGITQAEREFNMAAFWLRPLETDFSGLCPDPARDLSDARFSRSSRRGHGALRAFDKSVRGKPPVVAADAGLMQIQLREGEVSRCAEAVQQSTTDGTGR